MTFFHFAEYLQQLESTPSRLDMTRLLAELYPKFSETELAPASYLMLGSLVPAYQSLEFQLSTKMVIRALAQMSAVVHTLEQNGSYQGQQNDLFGSADTDKLVDIITEQYKNLGDLGETAQNLTTSDIASQKTSLSVAEVYQDLVQIARASGEGSQERKLLLLVQLLEQLEPLAVKYVVRMVLGKLRLGFSTMTILDALSWAVKGDKSAHDELELAFQKKADIGELARAYLRDGSVDNYTAQAGIPIVPALCQRLNSAQEIIEKMQTVIAEPKYDGLRAQIHFVRAADGTHTITAFTRSLENVTHMYPELEQVARLLQCQSCILDAEAIGYDPATNQLANFQTTITRKRKHDVESTAANVPIRFCVFDVVECDGKSLLDVPLIERKQLLRTLFEDSPEIIMTPQIVTSSADELRAYHHQLLAEGLEGAVIKKIDSTYVGGRKGWRWVKIKEEEGTSGKLADTLDLVVMGYYRGRGKRSDFGVGAFLVGVLEATEQPESQPWRILSIAKIGTGLTDEQFRELKQRCDDLSSPLQPAEYVVPKSLQPDAWIQPGLVVEIAADEITQSPVHAAGVALRFPRLIAFRDDKHWQQATQTSELGGIAGE